MVSVISMGVDRREELTGQAPPRPAVCTVVLGDPNDPMGVFVAPRMNENETRLKRTKAWDFKKSIFAQYKFESDKTYADSLGKDWVAAKTGKFIKDAKELELASEGLKAHYGAFLRLYRRCAAKSYGGSLTFGVSMQTCGELLSQCGVHDDQFCRQSDIDTMFIAARVREKGADKRPFVVKASDQLLRCQFLEFLVRVATAKYSKRLGVNLKDALNLLFEALEPAIQRPADDMRDFHADLHTEACDMVLKKNESFLRSMFMCHSGRFTKPGAEPRMSCKEFEEVLAGIGAYNETFPERDLPYAFLIGSQLYSDELYSLDFCTMNFHEFIHSLGAVVLLRRGSGEYSSRLGSFLESIAEKQGFAGMLRLLR